MKIIDQVKSLDSKEIAELICALANRDKMPIATRPKFLCHRPFSDLLSKIYFNEAEIEKWLESEVK